MIFEDLPRPSKADGQPRRVGVEMEFGGVAPSVAAAGFARRFGGRLVEDGPQSFQLVGSHLGDATIELDMRHVHPGKYGDELPFRLSPRSADWMGRNAGWIVPTELVTGPLAVGELVIMHEVSDALRELGAVGTGDFGLRACGLHFNIDLPSTDAATVTAYLKAYLGMEDELRRQVFGRRSARLPGSPPTFPPAYAARVLADGYGPGMTELVDHYLAANPTRQRGLDLLPLLLFLDEEKVRAALPREKIRKRPVLHYRLPFCRVERPGWSPAPDWNLWVEVERRAALML